MLNHMKQCYYIETDAPLSSVSANLFHTPMVESEAIFARADPKCAL